jgi:hypothetical protein
VEDKNAIARNMKRGRMLQAVICGSYKVLGGGHCPEIRIGTPLIGLTTPDASFSKDSCT